MTGFGGKEDKRRRCGGFDAHLTKPVELEALVKLLNEARTHRRGRPRRDAAQRATGPLEQR